MLAMTAGICFAAISIAAALYRKRVEKLEAEEDEDEENQKNT